MATILYLVCELQQENFLFCTNGCRGVFSVTVQNTIQTCGFFQTFFVNIARISDKLNIDSDFFRRSLLISLRSQMNLNINAPKGIGLPPASPSDKENNVDVRYYMSIRAIFQCRTPNLMCNILHCFEFCLCFREYFLSLSLIMIAKEFTSSLFLITKK